MGKGMSSESFFKRHKEHLFTVTTSLNIATGPDILSGEDIEKVFCKYPSFGDIVVTKKRDSYELLRVSDTGNLSICELDRTRRQL